MTALPTTEQQTLEQQPILNQPWEDVADDVTSAIERAVQPLLKKAVDDIYAGLLDATQDYLKGNLAFNIASRIDTAEREASHARQRNAELLAALRWALPLAEIAMDAHRMERIRCGHSDISGTYKNGVTWAGIYQAEVDQIETARSVLSNASGSVVVPELAPIGEMV